MTSLNRRQFMAASLAALASSLIPSCASSGNSLRRAMVGTQLYGWGQYYERMGKSLGANMDEVLSGVRDAGLAYAETSLDSGRPENNGIFASKLKERGLQPFSLYTGGRLHEKASAEQAIRGILAAAKVCREAGFAVINCNPDPIGREKTDAELAVQAESLNQLGRGLAEIGLKFGVHNHTPEMVSRAREFHHNFQHTDPAVVGFCFDVHWVYRGGIQPLDALKLYGERVVSWHLRQSREGVWWETVDSGDIDYEAVARYSHQHRLPQVYSVELALEGGTKVTRSVVENHRLSCDYVRRVFGV
jgi:inosose dehydratase